MSEDKGILLESGTNELELLEFVVGNQHYGINVVNCVHMKSLPVCQIPMSL